MLFLHSKEIFFSFFFNMPKLNGMPESENGAILWGLKLTKLRGRFRNLFDRPVNKYSPYLNVKCSTFQKGISRNFGVMEGFNGFDKKTATTKSEDASRCECVSIDQQEGLF